MQQAARQQYRKVEDLVNAYVETHEAEISFSVHDILAFTALNVPDKVKEPEAKKSLEREVELILEGNPDLFFPQRCCLLL